MTYFFIKINFQEIMNFLLKFAKVNEFC
jgi:hypothetical protein